MTAAKLRLDGNPERLVHQRWFKDIKAGDKLFAGDIIRVMYTTNGYGADIGGDWNTQSDTSLSALSFKRGRPDSRLRSNKTAYTLTLPQASPASG